MASTNRSQDDEWGSFEEYKVNVWLDRQSSPSNVHHFTRKGKRKRDESHPNSCLRVLRWEVRFFSHKIELITTCRTALLPIVKSSKLGYPTTTTLRSLPILIAIYPEGYDGYEKTITSQ
jgi:hypothetical protein